MANVGRIPRKVTQLDVETSEVIAVYSSMAEATDATGLESETMIRKALIRTDGVLKKYGLRFRYFEEGDEKVSRSRKIRQLDIDTNEEIEVYDSITEAANDNFMSFSQLYKALKDTNGELKNRGLKFEYV